MYPPIPRLPDNLLPSLTLSCGVLEPCFCPESPWGGSWDREGAHSKGLTASSRGTQALYPGAPSVSHWGLHAVEAKKMCTERTLTSGRNSSIQDIKVQTADATPSCP